MIDRRGFIGQSLALTALAVTEPSSVLAQSVRGHMDPAGRFGSLLNRAEFDAAPQVLSPAVIARFASQLIMRGIVTSGAARSHTLSPLPPVMMQGTNSSLGYPGSCEAQSFGYCLGTYTSAIGYPGFNPFGGPANHISAAFLFARQQKNQNETNCQGSMALPYPQLLVAKGAPSAQQVAYQPNCHYLDGIDTNILDYSGIGKFCIGSYKALPNFLNAQSTYVTQFKQYLNAGHAIAFSGLVAKGYDNPGTQMVRGAFDPQNFITGSGHGQVIVGYDDSLGHTGAFLVQNSFGTAWPYLGSNASSSPGRLYWTYESFFASQGFGAIAYPIPPPRALPSTAVKLTPSGSAPPGHVLEAIRSDDGGESLLVLELNFRHPVQLNTVDITPPGGSPVSGSYNAAIKYGFGHVSRSGSFPSGRYAVELNAHTLSDTGAPDQPVTYTAHVDVT